MRLKRQARTGQDHASNPRATTPKSFRTSFRLSREPRGLRRAAARTPRVPRWATEWSSVRSARAAAGTPRPPDDRTWRGRSRAAGKDRIGRSNAPRAVQAELRGPSWCFPRDRVARPPRPWSWTYSFCCPSRASCQGRRFLRGRPAGFFPIACLSPTTSSTKRYAMTMIHLGSTSYYISMSYGKASDPLPRRSGHGTSSVRGHQGRRAAGADGASSRAGSSGPGSPWPSPLRTRSATSTNSSSGALASGPRTDETKREDR